MDKAQQPLWPRRSFLATTLYGGFAPHRTGGLFQPAFVREMTGISARLFSGRETAALILSLDTGAIVACFQNDSFFGKPRPMGSLVKPFTAMAFAAGHEGNTPPEFFCPPGNRQESMEDCWYPPGHGSVDLEHALAHSCNRYFFSLAQETARTDFFSLLVRFGWIEEEQAKEFLSLSERESLSLMTGFSLRLQTEPIRTAYAFASLYNGGRLFSADSAGEDPGRNYRLVNPDPAVLARIRRGMFLCAQEGTARLLGRKEENMYAKTGTISRKPGSHNPAHLEGWCLGLHPDTGQRVLVMTRVKPGRGATEAVPLAAEAWNILQRWRRQEGL